MQVGEYTLFSGRMPPLPDWALAGGAVVGLQVFCTICAASFLPLHGMSLFRAV
jgi:hypothetical protein